MENYQFDLRDWKLSKSVRIYDQVFSLTKRFSSYSTILIRYQFRRASFIRFAIILLKAAVATKSAKFNSMLFNGFSKRMDTYDQPT